MATDAKKFHDVWVMNEEEAKGLVMKVLEEDRIIHEQQLGLPWDTPDMYVYIHNITYPYIHVIILCTSIYMSCP